MSSDKPLLVVLGATGTQGGSVVSHFLSQEPQPYRLRGITRDPDSAASKALIEKGVEMVAGNLDDPPSLLQAFREANTIFSVTDYWRSFSDTEHRAKAAAASKSMPLYSYEYEMQQGKNVFDAAAKTDSLDRLVFSSLSNASKWSRGRYTHVYHFDSKAHAEEYGKKTYPDLWKKTSIIQIGTYLNNLLPDMQYLSPYKVRLIPSHFLIGRSLTNNLGC
jgi:NmrA-like family